MMLKCLVCDLVLEPKDRLNHAMFEHGLRLEDVSRYGIFGGIYGSALFLLGLGFAVLYRKGGLIFAYLVSVCIYFVLLPKGMLMLPTANCL